MLDLHIDEDAFSGVISVRQGDATLYERAVGYADRSNRVPNTLATRFGIASGTKFLTALAVGRLIAAGRLSYWARLNDCVELNFPRYSPEITIRHLLTHTSGIPDYYDEEKVTDFDNFVLNVPCYELRGPRDYLPVFPDDEMKFEPGARFSYCNGGYILLGVVIEEMSGIPYREFVAREVFQAAGMGRSGFFAFDRLPDETALGYIEEAGGWRTNIYNLPIVGASDGGAYTTVGDLAKLWQAFWAFTILPKELVGAYAEPYVQAGRAGEHKYYGHGLWIREGEAALGGRGREVYMEGIDAGVSFMSGVNRDTRLQVTVISNTTEGAWPALRDIRAALKSESGV